MFESTYLHQNLRHQQRMSRAGGRSSTIKSDRLRPSNTYHITKATEAIGFGWGCLLLDNNLLWRQWLTWRAHIWIIWLGWRRLISLRRSIIYGLIWHRWTTIIWQRRGCRGWPPSITRRGIGRRAGRGRHLLNVIGREEPLVPVQLASPPICIRFSDYLDDIARTEGQIVGFLRCRQRLIGDNGGRAY